MTPPAPKPPTSLPFWPLGSPWAWRWFFGGGRGDPGDPDSGGRRAARRRGRNHVADRGRHRAIGGLIPHARAGRVALGPGGELRCAGDRRGPRGLHTRLWSPMTRRSCGASPWSCGRRSPDDAQSPARSVLREPAGARPPPTVVGPDRGHRRGAGRSPGSSESAADSSWFPALALVMGMSMTGPPPRPCWSSLSTPPLASSPGPGGPGCPGRRHRGSQRPCDRRSRGPVVEQVVGEVTRARLLHLGTHDVRADGQPGHHRIGGAAGRT